MFQTASATYRSIGPRPQIDACFMLKPLWSLRPGNRRPLMSDDDRRYSSDFALVGTLDISPAAIEFIHDYAEQVRRTQKLTNFAVVVVWADNRRSRNVDGVSWSTHGPGLCLHTEEIFAIPPNAAYIVGGSVVAIQIPAGIRTRSALHSIDIDPWTLPDPADPKSPMPGMGTIGLILL